MRWVMQNGIRYLQFSALAEWPGFFHGIVLREADSAEGTRHTLNFGLGCDAADDHAWENRHRVLALWNHPVGIFARQVHGVQAGVWSGLDAPSGRNRVVRLNGDALMTDQADCALVIQVADCQPVIMVDPVRRVIANVHSGWRGSIQNIIGHTVKAMGDRFGSRPEDLVAGVGPSLGPCCAEFVNYRKEIPPAYWGYRGSNHLFNFWLMSADQLRKAGLKSRNIHLAGICTKCNPHLFFSYRAEKNAGRFASIVGIKDVV